jgi:hypothetical protein
MIMKYIYLFFVLSYSNNIAAHKITLVALRVGGTNSKFSLFRNAFMHSVVVKFLRGERIKVMEVRCSSYFNMYFVQTEVNYSLSACTHL